MIEASYITAEMCDDFREAVKLGAEVGIREVSIRSKVWGQNLENLSGEKIREMADILNEHSVRASTILSPAGKCNIEDEAEVSKHYEIFGGMVELAHIFDSKFIRIFPFRRPGFQEYERSHLDRYLDLIVQRLKPIVQEAESQGVLVNLEWVGSTLAKTGREIRQVVDALGRPESVGLIWEIDVSTKAGELVSDDYEHVRGLVRDVHIKPNSQNRIDPAADSEDTYENALRLLLADGYEGTATIEHWSSQEGTLDGIKQLVDMLGRLCR